MKASDRGKWPSLGMRRSCWTDGRRPESPMIGQERLAKSEEEAIPLSPLTAAKPAKAVTRVPLTMSSF